LNFVSALAGYLTAQDGRKYAFALFSRDMTARQNADNENSEQPKGSMAWLTRSRNVQSGLMYRWARLDGATN
jgi:D-alanyl-D-alanine carboxypeptidase/D-alanyl-D-alanine-endopeptidase (penicillin-binding protein 4)